MLDFDIGKTAVVKRDLMIGIDQGERVVVAESKNDNGKVYVHIGFHLYKSDLALIDDVDSIDSNYQNSNRKKLKDAVIRTGLSAKDLSIAMGFNKDYLSAYTAESRMSSRGDISEDQLNLLKNSILFAERTLNDTGAKIVDELEFSDSQFKYSSNTTEADKKEIDGALGEIISDLWKGKYDQLESKKSNWMKLNRIAFGFCLFIIMALLYAVWYAVSNGH